jgi:hypothetical protein
MLIIAGHIEVDPDDRDEAVAVMRDPVTRACDAPGAWTSRSAPTGRAHPHQHLRAVGP